MLKKKNRETSSGTTHINCLSGYLEIQSKFLGYISYLDCSSWYPDSWYDFLDCVYLPSYSHRCKYCLSGYLVSLIGYLHCPFCCLESVPIYLVQLVSKQFFWLFSIIFLRNDIGS